MVGLIDHPSYYNKEGRKECIEEFVDKYGMARTAWWCLMTAEKYLYRAGGKEDNPEMQDLQKAKWYLNWARNHTRDTYLMGLILEDDKKLLDAFDSQQKEEKEAING